MEQEQPYKEVKFLELNNTARADALTQMAEVHEQDKIYEVSTAEDFADMIVNGYNPDRDFMFLQYLNDSVDKVTVYFKDFS
jgi:hypothetical protein